MPLLTLLAPGLLMGGGGTGIPPAPPVLSALGGVSQVALSWTDVSADSYNVYRGLSSGTETLYASGIVALGYVDTGVVNGTTYFYKVAGVNSAGEGGLSNEASATPVAGQPSGGSNWPGDDEYTRRDDLIMEQLIRQRRIQRDDDELFTMIL